MFGTIFIPKDTLKSIQTYTQKYTQTTHYLEAKTTKNYNFLQLWGHFWTQKTTPTIYPKIQKMFFGATFHFWGL